VSAALRTALQRLMAVAGWDEDTDRVEFDGAMQQAEEALWGGATEPVAIDTTEAGVPLTAENLPATNTLHRALVSSEQRDVLAYDLLALLTNRPSPFDEWTRAWDQRVETVLAKIRSAT
jgi:hypothetical protein